MPNLEERIIGAQCQLIWFALVVRAPEAMPITYNELARQTGLKFGLVRDRRGMRLNRLHVLCNENGLGPLDALVIRAEQPHLPGAGYFRNRRQEDAQGTHAEIWEDDLRRIRESDYTDFQDPGWRAFCA